MCAPGRGTGTRGDKNLGLVLGSGKAERRQKDKSQAAVLRQKGEEILGNGPCGPRDMAHWGGSSGNAEPEQPASLCFPWLRVGAEGWIKELGVQRAPRSRPGCSQRTQVSDVAAPPLGLAGLVGAFMA